MKQRRPYAGEITKEYLKKLGLEYVSTDGTIVIKNGKQVAINVSDKTKKPYGLVNFYDPEIRQSVPMEERIAYTGNLNLGVHVLNYVWNTGNTKPEGMVVDHIDNDPTNNELSNLQLLTQGENTAKERDNWYIYELKCKLNKPRSFYENKLKGYEMAYEQAKKDHDAEGAHQLRSNISQTRARLRYYDSHIAEVTSIKEAKEVEEARKREYHERAAKKRELKANIDSTRDYYKKLREVYGKDDPYVQKVWGEWKLAIAMYQGFCKEYKTGK